MSKTAAIVLAFIGCLLFSLPMSAQFNGLLPNGNVYAGVSYAQLTNVVNKQSYRGWNGSFEALPFTRFPRIGLVLDASGFYREAASPNTTPWRVLGSPAISEDGAPLSMPWPASATWTPAASSTIRSSST